MHVSVCRVRAVPQTNQRPVGGARGERKRRSPWAGAVAANQDVPKLSAFPIPGKIKTNITKDETKFENRICSLKNK